MDYFFINTDKKTLGFSPHDLWFQHGLAALGGPFDFGSKLDVLKPSDELLMHVNGKAILGIGRVKEKWNRETYNKPIIYLKPKQDEYRILVDWYCDLRDNPVSFDIVRKFIGWTSSQALCRITNVEGVKKLINWVKENIDRFK